MEQLQFRFVVFPQHSAKIHLASTHRKLKKMQAVANHTTTDIYCLGGKLDKKAFLLRNIKK